MACPFIAGTAALTWAAGGLDAGDVEACLSAARTGGPSGRFVNTYLATACGLGDPPNLAPLVQIIEPAEEYPSFPSVGPINLRAEAADLESGAIGTIFWTSDVEGPLGQTQSGQSLLYVPNGPGLRTITAHAFDANNARGEDRAFLSFNPAPPNVEIIRPGVGESVILGLPTDLIAHVTNLSGFAPTQPCDTPIWTGFLDNSIVFDQLIGCSTQGTFMNTGNGRVQARMTVNGLDGLGERAFDVISDGKLHVKITSPLVGLDLLAHLENGTAATLSAVHVGTANLTGGVTYTWILRETDQDGLQLPPIVVSGQNVTYMPDDFGCGLSSVEITVTAVDELGRIADDSLSALVWDPCPPP